MQSSNHPIIQSSNHPIIQPFNQAIKRSSDQATLPYFYHFYKNPLKNPLLFIIPSFINPIINPFINPHRNLFKKFDSISPIFKPVGLTELNSIQGEYDGSVRRFKSA
ncbi:hypothetical protein BXP23_02295 [Helicobacter pylori]|nr:hypothetical protein BXP20_02280 [Helicobacter pylori]AVG84748.1 hypothetical protein BXP19_02285 [Helicobacter pylori]AVG86228.1 hypothetical protein BXP18_02285 [Helicobacter pylori]AVG87714.1 hypothetical protein BXP21_02300 [Helicobacter pylori]AVG89197.1 hypothetical protein BXP22_02295 [Helicobacter pylori]